MSKRHTPPPYRAVCFNLGTFQINGTGEHELTEIADVCEFADGTDEANARFIVRACNSHDEMRHALTEVLDESSDEGLPPHQQDVLMLVASVLARAEGRDPAASMCPDGKTEFKAKEA